MLINTLGHQPDTEQREATNVTVTKLTCTERHRKYSPNEENKWVRTAFSSHKLRGILAKTRRRETGNVQRNSEACCGVGIPICVLSLF